MSENTQNTPLSPEELEAMLASMRPSGFESLPEDFRCGYVCVMGRPNVGKSTLINELTGAKVSITSKKPQTTRDRVLGVVSSDKAQLIFVDTPGYQTKEGSGLIRRMNKTVRQSLKDVDAIVFVIESLGWREADLKALALLQGDEVPPVILAINKIDLLKDKTALLPLIQKSMEHYPFHAVVPISAEKGKQTEQLVDELTKLLPVNPPLFDMDMYTDKTPRFIVAETIREKAFRLLGDELPYGVAVTIDKWEETDTEANIIATLIVERESHKPIVIGQKGAKLREIGRLARADVAELLGKRVHLEVWVRVRKGWSDDIKALKSLGYD